ncbi:amidase family protein, partial [Salmonella enterica]|uniref:amidase family protein n=1 Tax=Salmonella enterica TaxID=28901 RepID=UPI002351EFC5
DVEPTSWGMYQAGKKIKAKEYSKVLAYWDQMAAKMEELFDKYDAILLPTTNQPAPPHGQFDLDEETTEQMLNLDQLSWREQQDFLWRSFDVSQSWSPFTQQANLTGQPAISLPLYETQ